MCPFGFSLENSVDRSAEPSTPAWFWSPWDAALSGHVQLPGSAIQLRPPLSTAAPGTQDRSPANETLPTRLCCHLDTDGIWEGLILEVFPVPILSLPRPQLTPEPLPFYSQASRDHGSRFRA